MSAPRDGGRELGKNSGENALESFLSPSDHHSAGFKAVAGNGWFEMQKEVL